MPQIRENMGLVLTSPVPAVQNWINTGLTWAPQWINKHDGTFTDRIEATNVNKDLVVVIAPGNRRMFHALLQDQGGVLMNLTGPHIWQLSVNGVGIVDGTASTFSSTVADTRRPC